MREALKEQNYLNCNVGGSPITGNPIARYHPVTNVEPSKEERLSYETLDNIKERCKSKNQQFDFV